MAAIQGLILKMLHEGQKVYVVLEEDKGQTCVVRYPYGGQLFKKEVKRTALRTTTSGQRETYFDILRQLVGIAYHGPKTAKTAPIKVAAASKKVVPMTIAQLTEQQPMAIQCPECQTTFLEGHESHKPECSLNHEESNDTPPEEPAS